MYHDLIQVSDAVKKLLVPYLYCNETKYQQEELEIPYSIKVIRPFVYY